MLLKLATLRALGYAGYRYYEKNKTSLGIGRREPAQPALAGGPLSSQARLQSSPDFTG